MWLLVKALSSYAVTPEALLDWLEEASALRHDARDKVEDPLVAPRSKTAADRIASAQTRSDTMHKGAGGLRAKREGRDR
jgi:hypothetical protein